MDNNMKNNMDNNTDNNLYINTKDYKKLLEIIGNPMVSTYMYFVKEYYKNLSENKLWDGYVSVSNVGEYCSEQRKKEKGIGFGDPPRQFEIFRKDKTCGYWVEENRGKLKYVKFCIPTIDKIIVTKEHGFTNDIIKSKLKQSNNKCEITGLPSSESKLCADHWKPKEKFGTSEENNCVILNKILNEKKNNHLPEDWFCKHLLTNFLNICKRFGDIDIVKNKLVIFIQEFE